MTITFKNLKKKNKYLHYSKKPWIKFKVIYGDSLKRTFTKIQTISRVLDK